MTESHLARAEAIALACEDALLRAFMLALVGEVRRLRAREKGTR